MYNECDWLNYAVNYSIQGVRIKSAEFLKQYYSTTKRLAENIKTVLESWGIGLWYMASVNMT